MKKINLLFIAVLLLFVCNSFGQGVCSTIVYKYNGPKNKIELEKVINTSTNPVVQNLNATTKNALVNKMVFSNGSPIGIEGAEGVDPNIEVLYNSNAAEVFSAIFGMEVIISTYDTKPAVQDIAMDEFVRLTNGGIAFKTGLNWCRNCCYPAPKSPDRCCTAENGCSGCADKIVVINNTYYHVR